MKKFSALFLALCLILSLAACKNKNVNSNVSSNFTKNESTTTSKETENTESKTEESLGSGDSSQTASVASKPISASKPAETSKPTQSSKPTVTSKPSSAPSTPSKPTPPFDVEEGLFNGGNALALTDKGVSGLTANRILNRSSWEIFHGYIFDNIQGIESKDWSFKIGTTTYILKQYAVPENTVYQFAAMFFSIDAATKNILRASDRYDSAKGIYWVYPPDLWFQGYDAIIKGYESLGNDEYIVYAQAVETDHPGSPHSACATDEKCVISRPLFKAKIKATGARSFIVTAFDYIDKIPSNIIK